MERFLLVEDEPVVARMIARSLALSGDVDVVGTCAEARARATTAAPRSWTGAVVDVGLPDGSGLDFAEELRRRHAQLPLLILTAQVSHDHLRRAFGLRAGYLLKPAEPNLLREFAARATMGGHALSQAARRWSARYGLSPAETEILELAVELRPRRELAQERGVAESTIKRQITTLLNKTGDVSLDGAVARLMQEELVAR